MTYIVYGMNHQQTPISVREKVFFEQSSIEGTLKELLQCTEAREAVILSTCNRTELYCHGDPGSSLVDWWSRRAAMGHHEVKSTLYRHDGTRGVAHIMRVACGLDSMVIGEPEILGQMKQAYQVGQRAGTVGANLHRLFPSVFSVSKRVRRETLLGANPVTLAYLAVHIAKRIFSDLSQLTFLFIGAGQTIASISQYVADQRVKGLLITNRRQARAELLAEKLPHAQVIPWEALNTYLHKADVVIAATSSAERVVDHQQVLAAVSKRRNKPMLLVDLGLPRNIDPKVDSLEQIYAYNLDDLHKIIQDNFSQRFSAAKQAEMIIDSQAHRFIQGLRELDAVETIRSYRSKVESMRQEVLIKAASKLSAGDSPLEVLSYLSNTLTNKIMHDPCVQLRRASFEGNLDMLSFAKKLFDL